MLVGDRVYVWDPKREEPEISEGSGYILLGEVESVDEYEVVLKSIMDDKFYRRKVKDVFNVGTGPLINKSKPNESEDPDVYF